MGQRLENEVFVCFSTCSDGTKNTGSNGIDMVTTNPGASESEKVHLECINMLSAYHAKYVSEIEKP